MVDEFGHAEVLRSLLRVQLVLCVAALQPLILCVDVHLNTYQPVPAFPEAVHNSEQFFIMDWPVPLCGKEGFCVVLNWMKLLRFVDELVLRQDTSNCLIANIGFHNCLQGSIELSEDGRGVESCLDFIAGLLLCMSTSEGDNLCQVDDGLCISTIVHDKSTVIISKA